MLYFFCITLNARKFTKLDLTFEIHKCLNLSFVKTLGISGGMGVLPYYIYYRSNKVLHRYLE